MPGWVPVKLRSEGGEESPRPPARGGHAMAVIQNRKLVLYGGSTGQGKPFHDVWLLETGAEPLPTLVLSVTIIAFV
jgi:Kelch motif